MRKWLILILLAAGLIFPVQATAQASLSIDRMEVDIWPEYDRPEVLVIYHVFLPANTTFPAQVTLRIPAAAGEPYNVAVRDADQNLYTVDYTRTEEGEWALISFPTSRSEIQFEYYDPALKKDAAARSFTYRWPGDYPVKSLAIQVQQPVGASAMQISPSLGSGLTGGDGLVYFNAQVGEVPAGNPFEVSFTYQKNDDALSAQSIKVEPAGPVSTETAGRTNFDQYLPWVLGVLGLILIAGGGLWYYQSQSRLRAEPATRRRHAPTARETSRARRTDAVSGMNAVEEDEFIYCHQCGRRAAPADRFCRACGAELRK
jgi:hypothetical protein